ncbi:peptidylprolyl isomerase [Cytobacillus spongiae]|jgi:foldase protein PrsA|uniref:peptidylprolyl isomerase n=1 Tax=Cytobacillus spongiae TaxID=2901381 RepID=UPI001F3F3D02|nr:peptidylprolyl isomerase [Cytobacillus spongiae]UII56880.1 peptidylprolyl isomerase [Cytobacillus spongiae]
MKKKWLLSLTLAAGVIGLSACNNASSSDVIVETKAGNITKDELYEAMKEKYGEQALQELVYEKVLSEKYEVTDEELDAKIDELKQQLGANFEMALAQYGYASEDDLRETFKTGLLQEKAAIKDIEATEDELKEYYDNFKPQIKARHILVEDEETAKEIKAKLDKGDKFEDLAKEFSQDPGSAANGGDLGWFGAGQMVPEFEEAAYALEVNGISDPVKSEHGYHIIQTTEKKEKKSFDEMKEEIEYKVKTAKLDGEKIQAAMDRELKDAKVDIKDKDLKGILEQKEAE